MAVRLIKVGNSYNMPIHEYVCDQLQEMSAIVTSLGDRVTVAEEGVTYVRNSLPHSEQEEAKWVVVSSGSSGGAALTGKEFDENESYKEGDYVTKDGLLYVAQEAIAAGTDFDEALEDEKWKETPFILYADDVVDGYYNAANGKFYSDSAKTQEIDIEKSKIYVDQVNGQILHKGNSGLETIGGAPSNLKFFTGTIEKEKLQNDDKYTYTLQLNEEINTLAAIDGAWFFITPIGSNPLYEEIQSNSTLYTEDVCRVRIIDSENRTYNSTSLTKIARWGINNSGTVHKGLVFRANVVSNSYTLNEIGRNFADSSTLNGQKKYYYPGIVFLTDDYNTPYSYYALSTIGASALKDEIDSSIEIIGDDLDDTKEKIRTYLSTDLSSDIIESRVAYYTTERSFKLLDSDIENTTPTYTTIMEQEG